MAISQVNNTASNPLAASSNSGTSSAAEQQDRFMKLLVAQMKNQDPLNPMDNAQMTSQIAQINTVSGIEKLNTTVTSLLASFNNLQAQSATQLPGRSVLVPGTGLTLADGKAMGGVELGGAADAVTVDIVDATGATVRSLSLGASTAGVRSFNWDGLLADGKTAPAGDYRIRVSATAGGNPVPAGALAVSRVQAVSTGSNGVQLDLGSAGTRAYSDVRSFL
ncbi:MAG: flagellar hook assembly protein FlgD [Pseudomonadota bacterium]